MHAAFVTSPLAVGAGARTSTFVSLRTSTQRTRTRTRTVATNAYAARMALEPASVVNALQFAPLAEGGGMAVTFPAYLAVFLGTLIPCAFLVILYIQAESRKAGEKAGRGE